jgi:hypothetical protein
MLDISIDEETTIRPVTPILRLPDASTARDVVQRWLLREIGTAAYPGDATFQPESFTWHIPIWLSYAEKPQIGILADVYLHAATGIFLGRPSHEDLLNRAEALLQQAR